MLTPRDIRNSIRNALDRDQNGQEFLTAAHLAREYQDYAQIQDRGRDVQFAGRRLGTARRAVRSAGDWQPAIESRMRWAGMTPCQLRLRAMSYVTAALADQDPAISRYVRY